MTSSSIGSYARGQISSIVPCSLSNVFIDFRRLICSITDTIRGAAINLTGFDVE
jgi:hypothetical protein